MGIGSKDTFHCIKLLMDELELQPADRSMVTAFREARKEAKARGKGKDGILCAAGMELKDGTIITGTNSEILHALSALVLNPAKHLAGIPRAIDFISKNVTDSIQHLKRDVLQGRRISLDADEVPIALAMSAASNPSAEAAQEQLHQLSETEVHLTHLPSPGNEAGLRKLGINVTSEPQFASNMLHDD